MKSLGVLIGLLATLHSTYGSGLPLPPTVKPSSASVACTRSGSNMTLTFFLVDGGLDYSVEMVYLVNATDIADITLGNFSTTTGGITGSGIDGDPWTFSIDALIVTDQRVNSVPPYEYLSLPDASIQKMAYVENLVNLTVHVMTKSNESIDGNWFSTDIIYKSDIVYIATCDLESIQDNVVSTGKLTVTGTVDEVPASSTLSMEMEIYTDNGPKTNLKLGDKMWLRMSAPLPTDIKSFFPKSCYACALQDCSDKTGLLVDQNGCSTGYVGEFNSIGNLTMESGSFNVFTFPSQQYMFFQCSVTLCLMADDPTCTTPPSCSGRKGRKRRALEENEEDFTIVSTFLKIDLSGGQFEIEQLDENPGFVTSVQQKQAEAKQQQELKSDALVGSVITLAVLLVVGTVAAIVIFWRLASRKP